jgi:uncharacterized protein (DUF1778 family)
MASAKKASRKKTVRRTGEVADAGSVRESLFDPLARPDDSHARARRRAPRRDGRRTTLRLPDELAAVVDEAAAEAGTTENDVVVLFALKGAELYARRRATSKRGEERWRAVSAGHAASTAPLPALGEMREAATSLRRELASE